MMCFPGSMELRRTAVVVIPFNVKEAAAMATLIEKPAPPETNLLQGRHRTHECSPRRWRLRPYLGKASCVEVHCYSELGL